MADDYDFNTGEVISPPRLRPPIPPEISSSIIKVIMAAKKLDFNERNPHGGYNYTSVDKFMEVISPIMAEAGLFVIIDEIGNDVRAGGGEKKSPWLFAQYEILIAHSSGTMWGPLRRHLALPLTGPQTFGAAESYVVKQLLRVLFMVPTGEKDADVVEPHYDAPVTRLPIREPAPQPVARVAAPRPARPAPAPARQQLPATPNGGGQPTWISEFLARPSYAIDPKKAGGFSAWEKFYLTVADHADNWDQLKKLEQDNTGHIGDFRSNVQAAVAENFAKRIAANERRLAPELEMAP